MHAPEALTKETEGHPKSAARSGAERRTGDHSAMSDGGGTGARLAFKDRWTRGAHVNSACHERE